MCSTKMMSWIMIPVVLGFFLGSILVRVQMDVATELVTINPMGDGGQALIVYHPGLSGFQEDVTFAYVEGLTSSGWACDVITASREAPTDLNGYDMLVLGTPTYEWKPASPITRYVARVGDLGGLPTAFLVTGGGSTESAAALLLEQIGEANGNVIQALEIWQSAPNEEFHGISDPIEIARRAGATLTLP